MKALGMLFCAAVLAHGIAGCNAPPPQPPDTHDADVKAISDNEDQWNKDYVAKDLEKVAAHYADDAVMMTPGEPVMQGKQAIHDGMQENVEGPGDDAAVQIVTDRRGQVRGRGLHAGVV